MANKNNLKKIVKIVHLRLEKNGFFFKRNNKKKIVILDIPLLLENKINKKKDILVFLSIQRKNLN